MTLARQAICVHKDPCGQSRFSPTDTLMPQVLDATAIAIAQHELSADASWSPHYLMDATSEHAPGTSARRHDTRRRSRTRSRHRVIDVQDASRVLECAQVERQLHVQHVVRRYLSQMLHGCNSAYCDTPTCLSAQKRNTTRPLRPPTQLTARAIAHYLASQDDPSRGLCPHELKVPPASLEIDGATGTRLRHGSDLLYSVYPLAASFGQPTSSRTRREEGASDHAQTAASHVQEHVVDAVRKRLQARKDTKSLSQNLFDSVTMIYAYSKQLPTSATIIDTLRSCSASLADATLKCGTTEVASQTTTENDPHRVTGVSDANSYDDTLHVNGRPRFDRQRSHSELRVSGFGHSLPSSPEVLSNGQYVHRIPYHKRDTASAAKGPNSPGQLSLDGTLDKGKLSITKRARNTAHDMGRVTPFRGTLSRSETYPKSHAHNRPAIPVLSKLNCDTMEELKEDVFEHRKHQLSDELNFAIDFDTNGRFRPSKPFVNRSLFYTLNDPEALLKSFHDGNKAFEKSPLPHLDSAHLTHSFRDWNRRNGALIFDSLWVALGALYTPPQELHARRSPRLRPSRKIATRDNSTENLKSNDASDSSCPRYFSNLEAAHIVMICIHALTSLVPVGWPHTWAQLRKLRSWGVVMPNAPPATDEFTDPYLNIVDELEYEPAIRLAERLLSTIGARTCFEHILETLRKQDSCDNNSAENGLMDTVVQHLKVVERIALASKRRMTPTRSVSDDPGWTVTATFLEWLKTVVTKKWDSKVHINKWSSVGTAVMLLDKLYWSFEPLNLRASMFEIPFFDERMDNVEDPLKFLTWEEQPNTLHILQYPMLFPAEYLVRYFRTVNFTSMMTQYDQTTRTHQMQRSLEMFLQDPHLWLIRNRMGVTLSEYLILNVSREAPLKDTLDQLWGLEKRMLLKPLKVKMGQDEGELGADHGGVTYEFFRVVLSEALKPDHGMFTLDPQTRMTWFQPNTLEPEWKFEMIGNLFSLAVYNGITLPVTFPLALYRFLLPTGSPLRKRDISENGIDILEDGWPDLAKGFQQLLDWTDGDVSDVFMRDYAFSYQAFGQRIDHNMDEHYTRPQPTTQQSPAIRPEHLLTNTTKEAKPVTNKNRHAFVRDYIHHLTYLSVSPQLHAFRKGFLACLAPRSLHFFSPLTLRNLIEGQQHISIPDLRRCARYHDGYSATHPTIQSFWRIVEQYDQDDRRHLLEFVTASDRVPVTGYEGITFHVVRVGDPGLLPTSSTCFGRLHLPEYKDEEVMGRKLGLAIRNSKGFGVV